MTQEQRRDFTVRKENLWESETATDAEARQVEMRLIAARGAHDPARGYKVLPKHRPLP